MQTPTLATSTTALDRTPTVATPPPTQKALPSKSDAPRVQERAPLATIDSNRISPSTTLMARSNPQPPLSGMKRKQRSRDSDILPCDNCKNNLDNKDQRVDAIQSYLANDPRAFSFAAQSSTATIGFHQLLPEPEGGV
ncbi:hypothetical protein ATCC90586_005109 [Pythium insidiosum]|nr:hypothetical protein ATCC90586_005109 [Pythium insidiosum]